MCWQIARQAEKIFCVGCGEDITTFRVKHVLCSDISKDAQEVRSLWCYLFDEELVKIGLEEQARNLVTTDTTGKMCRRCFNTFKRCSALINSIRTDVAKAVQTFQDNGSLNSTREAQLLSNNASLRSLPSTPAPKRLAVATDSNLECPNVVVKLYVCYCTYFTNMSLSGNVTCSYSIPACLVNNS